MPTSDAARKKIVWILGAGFSKPLGGPLLGQLLTMQSAVKIGHVYANMEVARKCEAVATLYHHGTVNKHWSDAEEFLELLDLATEDESARKLLIGWANSSLSTQINSEESCAELRFDGLRMLAAEVCIFLKGKHAKTERLAPYVARAKSLGERDTILTFNYDRVIELVAKEGAHEIVVPRPQDAQAACSQRSGSPVALKLHGSVDWYFDLHNNDVRRDDAESAMFVNMPKKLAIATPGPTKHRMISNDGIFEPLWRCAREELQLADAVVLIGYRMPPTDAFTKQWLIDRLREVSARKQASGDAIDGPEKTVVHTVLGPGLDSADNGRLRGLLREIDRHVVHKAWDMGSEDFLGLIPRERLLHTAHWAAAARAGA